MEIVTLLMICQPVIDYLFYDTDCWSICYSHFMINPYFQRDSKGWDGATRPRRSPGTLRQLCLLGDYWQSQDGNAGINIEKRPIDCFCSSGRMVIQDVFLPYWPPIHSLNWFLLPVCLSWKVIIFFRVLPSRRLQGQNHNSDIPETK